MKERNKKKTSELFCFTFPHRKVKNSVLSSDWLVVLPGVFSRIQNR